MNAFAIVRALIRTKRAIIKELHQLKHEVRHMADEVAHLTNAVTLLTTAVTEAGDQIKAETGKILELLANPSPTTGVDPVAVEAAAQSINALAAGLHDAVAAAQGALATPAP